MTWRYRSREPQRILRCVLERMLRRMRTRTLMAFSLAACVAALTACGYARSEVRGQHIDGADPARGAATIEAYGCGSCHSIPGVRGAQGMVGPPLEHWAQRRIIAGEIPNDPQHLITWLKVPQSVEPGTAMPNMGVSDAQARDMAAYLYTLR